MVISFGVIGLSLAQSISKSTHFGWKGPKSKRKSRVESGRPTTCRSLSSPFLGGRSTESSIFDGFDGFDGFTYREIELAEAPRLISLHALRKIYEPGPLGSCGEPRGAGNERVP